MRRVHSGRRTLAFAILAAAFVALTISSAAGAARGDDQLQKINHIVVIYEENHSFDNLYGGWEGVDGRGSADDAHTLQVGEVAARTPYDCLLQNDVNLTAPSPLSAECSDTTEITTFVS